MTLTRKTSILLSPAAQEALKYLRAHPLPFVLGQEVSRIVVQEAMDRGWRPAIGRPISVIYVYDRHHVRERRECATLEKAILAAVKDIEENTARPVRIEVEGAAVWANGGPAGDGVERLFALASTHGVPVADWYDG